MYEEGPDPIAVTRQTLLAAYVAWQESDDDQEDETTRQRSRPWASARSPKMGSERSASWMDSRWTGHGSGMSLEP
jgi:hypothetical protein